MSGPDQPERTDVHELDSESVEIDSDAFEARYRAHYAHSHGRQVMVGLAVLAIPMVGFTLTDFLLFGIGATFTLLVVVRLVVVVGALAVFRTISAGKSPAEIDRALLCQWIVFAAAVTTIDATRPPNYVLHVAMDVLFVLTAYVLPSRWSDQIVAGALLTIGPGLVLVFGKSGMTPITITLCVSAFVYANALGLMLSRNLHVANRAEFEQRERAHRARTTLRAITRLLPMCASCKSIRDGGGHWRRVEDFVQQETGHDISHGLCESCVRTLYPEFAARGLAEDDAPSS